jgi:hypothetical protein
MVRAGGGWGIRTPEGFDSQHGFQPCAIGLTRRTLQAVRRAWGRGTDGTARRERDLNPRDPCGPTRFRGGRTRPDYAIPPGTHARPGPDACRSGRVRGATRGLRSDRGLRSEEQRLHRVAPAVAARPAARRHDPVARQDERHPVRGHHVRCGTNGPGSSGTGSELRVAHPLAEGDLAECREHGPRERCPLGEHRDETVGIRERREELLERLRPRRRPGRGHARARGADRPDRVQEPPTVALDGRDRHPGDAGKSEPELDGSGDLTVGLRQPRPVHEAHRDVPRDPRGHHLRPQVSDLRCGRCGDHRRLDPRITSARQHARTDRHPARS